MAQIAVSPLVLKDVLLQIGADSYEKHVSNVTFTPSPTVVTWQGLSPDASFTDTGRASWTVSLTYAQDWDTPNSLSAYLFNHEGDTVEIEFAPRNGVGPSFIADVVITPGAIGGAVNTVSEATVTLGISGKPVLVPGD